MQNKKDVLTTGQVAHICNVAPRTVTKWFDSGQLKGYRIPGSRDRRIPACELVRFMKIHDMPTDAIEIGKMRILLIDTDSELSQTLPQGLTQQRNFEVYTASNSFDAGLIAQKSLPHVILINLMAQNIDAWQVCKNTRANEDLISIKVVAIAEKLKDNEVSALINKGFDAVITDPTDIQAVIATIQEVTAIIY
ncbi:MAG: helix-turn-helix domain-containing protein [Anaerohalosphaera sp.]|nr:helix-turn-helix domain-containing protein [Anaerohalosphaera sp.]